MLTLPLAPMAPADDLGRGFDDLSVPAGLEPLLTDLASVRRLALRLAEQTDDPIRAGQLHAFGLVHGHQRQLLESIAGPDRAGLTRALRWLVGRFGARPVRVMLHAFRADYRGEAVPALDGSATSDQPATTHVANTQATETAPDAASVDPQDTATGDTATGDILARDIVARDTASSPDADEDDAAVLGQLVLLWLANENPAAAPFRPLFDDRQVEEHSGYRSMIASLSGYFADSDPEPANQARYAAIQAPVEAAPSSPADQLRAVLATRRPGVGAETGTDASATDRTTPRATPRGARRGARQSADTRPLAPGFHDRPTDHQAQLLRGLDILREEEKPGFAPGPPPPPPVPDFAALAGGVARYSTEAGWMRELVLVAKNVLVWLDQLSGRYGRTIEQLDQIPDDELARFRRWGITGLWLIGIWQRSEASARIKQLCGNPEAAASAYAVDEYVIDQALGGDVALDRLSRRAARHGIRLACDMVPNHMGLDSRWVLDHPERFLQVAEPPFPGYRFDDGPDLSPRSDIGLHLEEGYFDRRDAAVVFRRTATDSDDAATPPETTYLYHGNDGTSLPWNDTAQLDFTRDETRQAVLETILEVAKRFPIIRFDAAMTLARQHVQRLWHPLPGTGGDVPSRAEHAVDQATFDRQMPEEFWRQVADRASVEAPDTLLLAEAFWLMETYFVRTLGMHRVYNSAFMHMIREEDNARFHRFVAEALAFDPALVARFVSFATTPDESPAAEQFGTGDKYFAVATLLFAMPGTPLIGHGQIEGLREKYGMEYRRAYRQEAPESEAIRRHETELVPLLARRAVFAAAGAFELYVFEKESQDGEAEDVIAVSNRLGASRGLVVVHNRAGTIRGRLRRTVSRPRGEDVAASVSIARALGIDTSSHPHATLRGRDLLTGQAIEITGRQLEQEGLRISLGPYERIVWGDLVLQEPEASPAADEGLAPNRLQRLLSGLLPGLLETDLVRRLIDLRPDADDEDLRELAGHDPGTHDPSVRPEAHQRWTTVASTLGSDDTEQRFATLVARLDGWIALHDQARRAQDERTTPVSDSPSASTARPSNPSASWPALLAWVFVHSLGRAPCEEDTAPGAGEPGKPGIEDSETGLPETGLPATGAAEMVATRAHARMRQSLFDLLASLGCASHSVVRQVAAASRFCWHPSGDPPVASPADFATWLAHDADAQSLLGKHEHDGVTWIEQEGVRALCWWLTMTARLDVGGPESSPQRSLPAALLLTRAVITAETASGYRWPAFLRALRDFRSGARGS